MQSGMTAQISAAGDDPVAIQRSPLAIAGLSRRTLIFLAVGLIAYLLGLIATIPAGAVITENERTRFGGTIWNGNFVIGSQIRVDWDFAPLVSLGNLGMAARWHAFGGGTDVGGDMISRGEQMTLDQVSGQIDGTLLAALAPRLPFDCSFVGVVSFDRIRLGGVSGQELDGRTAIGPSRCATPNSNVLPASFPAISGDFIPGPERSSGTLSTVQGNIAMVEVRLSDDGLLSIWPSAMAVERAPVLVGKRYDERIE